MSLEGSFDRSLIYLKLVLFSDLSGVEFIQVLCWRLILLHRFFDSCQKSLGIGISFFNYHLYFYKLP